MRPFQGTWRQRTLSLPLQNLLTGGLAWTHGTATMTDSKLGAGPALTRKCCTLLPGSQPPALLQSASFGVCCMVLAISRGQKLSEPHAWQGCQSSHDVCPAPLWQAGTTLMILIHCDEFVGTVSAGFHGSSKWATTLMQQEKGIARFISADFSFMAPIGFKCCSLQVLVTCCSLSPSTKSRLTAVDSYVAHCSHIHWMSVQACKWVQQCLCLHCCQLASLLSECQVPCRLCMLRAPDLHRMCLCRTPGFYSPENLLSGKPGFERLGKEQAKSDLCSVAATPDTEGGTTELAGQLGDCKALARGAACSMMELPQLVSMLSGWHYLWFASTQY